MRRSFMTALLLLVCLTVVFSQGSKDGVSGKDAPIVLKIALQNGESHPLCMGVAKFAENLERNTNGRITMDLYYSGALGDKPATVQGMQMGTIDGAMLMSGVIADYGCDEMKAFTLPYLFDSVDHARRFNKSEAGRALLDKIQSSGTRMVCIGTYQESARNYFFTKKDVKTPADLKNMLIRCQEGAIYYDTMEAMGSFAQSIAFSELFSALQAGVVDGAEQPLSGFVTNSFHEICKYYIRDQHEISPNLILFSEITWNKLSEDDKAVILSSFNESVEYFEELSDARDMVYIEQMLAAGVKITDVNISEWQDACASIYEKYGTKYKDIIASIRAAR